VACCRAESGNRLHLALTLKAGANVLLLDEPTNDIDVNTLRALEEGVGEFRGLRRGDFARPLVPGTVSVPISWRLRVTPKCSTSKDLTASTRRTKRCVSATWNPSGSGTGNYK